MEDYNWMDTYILKYLSIKSQLKGFKENLKRKCIECHKEHKYSDTKCSNCLLSKKLNEIVEVLESE